MATFHVKAKKPWKTVDLNSSGFSQKDLEGLISFQELTDYEITGSKRKKSKEQGKSKGEPAEGNNSESESLKANLKTGKKEANLKRKKNKRKSNETSNETKNSKEKLPTKKDKLAQKKKLKQKKKNERKSVVKGKTVEDLNELMLSESSENSQEKNQKIEKKGGKRKNNDKREKEVPKKKVKLEPTDEVSVDEETDTDKHDEAVDKTLKGMEAWDDLFVPKEVLWALKSQGFREPTPIQSQILPSAIRDKMDIVGAAETGSGKTLAFGIPVLHFILEQKKREADKSLNDIGGSEPEGEDYENEEIGEENDDSDPDDDDDENVKGVDMDDDNDNAVGDSDDGDENIDIADKDDDGSDGEVSDDDDDDETVEIGDVDDDDDDEQGEEDDDNGEEDEEEDNDDDDSDEQIGISEEVNKDDSSEEELEDVTEGGMGCVKVIKDVDFSWLGEPVEALEPIQHRATHPRALILEPTRELAIQVKNHLRAAAKYTDITVEVIVGGLAMPRQQRILKKCPDILVATPGRLWELVQQGETYLSEIEKTYHLVVDEADRMTEKGHYEELAKLLEKMKRDPNRQNRHTYVFSATLTLIHAGPQRIVKKKKKNWDEKQKLFYLMRKMGLKYKPKVVNLTRKVGTVESLTEAKINCTKEEKDIYLYYFLKHYPGRTLVFTNSKDCIRRLVSVFSLLQCNPLPLHADMHQRQRLKNLDKFTSNPTSLLIASDVAARGLDIPNVQHVIHYQVPHTVENYVHRSGRTARASKEGLSIMIIGPDDTKNYRKIIRTLNKDEDLPIFPVEQNVLTEIKRRVNMVREIETQEYRFKKSKRHNDWFKKAADEIGVDIEEELLNDIGDDAEQQRHSRYIKQMKAELSVLLRQPLLLGSSFTKYPTMSGKLVTPPAREAKGDALAHAKKSQKSEISQVTPQSTTKPKTKTEKRRERRERRKNKKLKTDDVKIENSET